MIDLARHAARDLRKIGIVIDWRATFEEFVEAHGGLPVKHGGRLLFADGWAHALDHRGPEFPPPSDKTDEGRAALARLRWVYQVEKRKALLREKDWLEGTIAAFEEAQRLRSAPLQRRVKTDELDEFGNPRYGNEPLRDALVPLRMRLTELTMPELRSCEAAIAAMEDPTLHEVGTAPIGGRA